MVLFHHSFDNVPLEVFPFLSLLGNGKGVGADVRLKGDLEFLLIFLL
jgi:hypothetical protein